MAFAMLATAFTFAMLATAFTFAMLATAFAFAMLATAFVLAITMPTAAFVLLVMLFAIALAVIAIAAATAAAGAAHLLGHGLCHFLICGGAPLLDGNAEVLIHHGKHVIQLLTRLQESLTHGVIHYILTQAVKSGDFLLGGGHAFHVLVAKLLAVFIDLAEKISCFGVLIEEPDASLGRNHLLALCKCSGQLSCQFHQFRCE